MFLSSPIDAVSSRPDTNSQEAVLHVAEVNVGLRFGLSMFQVILGTVLHSHALLASGLYLLAGLIAELVSLLAVPEEKIPQIDGRCQGFHHCVNATWLIVGLVMLTIGGVLSAKAVGEVNAPGTMLHVDYMAPSILLSALIVRSVIYFVARRMSGRILPPLPAAKLEQLFADIGAMLVAGAGMAGSIAGYPICEPVATMTVGLMMIGVGGRIAINAGHCLRDRLADAWELNEIRDTLLDVAGVSDVHDLRIQKMADMLTVEVMLELDATLSIEMSHKIATDARRCVLARRRVLEVQIQTTMWRPLRLVEG